MSSAVMSSSVASCSSWRSTEPCEYSSSRSSSRSRPTARFNPHVGLSSSPSAARHAVLSAAADGAQPTGDDTRDQSDGVVLLPSRDVPRGRASTSAIRRCQENIKVAPPKPKRPRKQNSAHLPVDGGGEATLGVGGPRFLEEEALVPTPVSAPYVQPALTRHNERCEHACHGRSGRRQTRGRCVVRVV